MGRKTKRVGFFIVVGGIAFCAVIFLLYRYNYIPHKKYDTEFFGIQPYVSQNDKDGDLIDDQTDILQSARQYTAQKPRYKSKYYADGYPSDGYGVCTDVVAQAMLGAGYDLMELVDEDIRQHQKEYDILKSDKHIDFRRVKNLKVYFKNTAQSLTTDIYDIESWHGGDIVIFKKHIGIVSDKRNKKGIPFVIHHANPFQADYEEDILEIWGKVEGHYRIQ